MQSFEFDTDSQQLKPVPTSERGFVRSLLRGSSELEKQPVDRTKFFTTEIELNTAVNGLATMFVDKNEPADNRGVLKAPSSLIEPGDELLSHDIQEIIEANGSVSDRLNRMVTNARIYRKSQALTENWWHRFSDDTSFSYNVFKHDPTEQITIGRDQIEPVTVYNFGEKLRKRHVESVIGAVAAMSAMTDGYTRALTPYIVIHDAFKEQYFQQGKRFDKAAGRAWLGEPFIEARRSSFDGSVPGSAGQSWVSQLIGHEISHQIDEEVSAHYPEFNSYFHYIDENHDGLIDYVKPLSSFASEYTQHHINTSRPVRQYGYTNSTEDLATVGEEVPFGGAVDALRKDAYMKVIEAFKEKSYIKHGDMQPLPQQLKVEVARGGEINLPVAAALSTPIRIRVENTAAGRVNDFFKQIFS